MPTLNSAGVPLNIIYNVMEATARTAKKPHAVKIASAALSTVDLLHDGNGRKMFPVSLQTVSFRFV